MLSGNVFGIGFAGVMVLAVGSSLVSCAAGAQSAAFASDVAVSAGQGALESHGEVTVDGRTVAYRIRRLPVSSFPELPAAVASQLTARGCLIPQSDEAKRPENVIHASLERAGAQDWAVLCSVEGEVSLLVFFGRAVDQPAVLAKRAELKCLEKRRLGTEMGFGWDIDRAAPVKVHDAQASLPHRMPLLDRDCVAESLGDEKTIYHLYRNGAWETVPTE